MIQPLFRLKQQVLFTLKFNTPPQPGVIVVITHWRRGDEVGYQVQTTTKRYWVRERFVQPKPSFAQLKSAPNYAVQSSIAAMEELKKVALQNPDTMELHSSLVKVVHGRKS